jgi:uncharacterized lipoprotein YbaY
MKKSYSIALVAVTLLAACSQNETEVPNTEPTNNMVAFAGTTSDKTRTAYENTTSTLKTTWVRGDGIGIFAMTGATSIGDNTPYKAAGAGTGTGFSAVDSEEGIEWIDDTSAHDFYAYYPYSESAGGDPTAVVVSLPAAQTQGSGLGHFAPLDFMYASAKGVTKEDGTVKLPFDHLFTVLEVKMTATDGVAIVNSLTLVCNDAAEAVAFSGTLDLTNPAAGVTVIESTNSVTLSLSSPLIVTSDAPASAFMMISAGHEGKTFELYATIEGESDPVLIATRTLAAGQSIPAGVKAVIEAAIDASSVATTPYDKVLGTWSIKSGGQPLAYSLTFSIDEYQKSYKVVVNSADLGEDFPIIAKFENGKVVIWNRQQLGIKNGDRYISLHYNGVSREEPASTLIFSIPISWEATPVTGEDGALTLTFADDGQTDYIAESLNIWNCAGAYFNFSQGGSLVGWTNLVLTKSLVDATVSDFEEWNGWE